MSTERDLHGDVTRAVRSWLHEDRHEDVDRVLGAVLDEVDTTPQRRFAWLAQKEPFMNKFVAIGLGAAAVIAALFFGMQFVGQPNMVGGPAETPSPSVAPSATPAPSEAEAQDFVALPQFTTLEPGQYNFDQIDPIRVTLTVPSGWEKNNPHNVIWSVEDNKATLALMRVDNLSVDPCAADGRLHDPAIGPSVDDLVTALANVPGWESSTPTEVMVDGFNGQYLEFVSASPSADCAEEPVLWQVIGDRAGGESEGAPTEDTALSIWILDVNETRLVITTKTDPSIPESRVAQLEEMIDSIQIE